MNENPDQYTLSERDAKIVDFDIAYMNENYTQARQHESQRAQMTAITFALSGTILAIIISSLSPELLLTGGLIIFGFGAFGSRFSTKAL